MPARRSDPSSPATRRRSRSTLTASATATRCREPGPGSRPARRARRRRADRRAAPGRRRDRRRAVRGLPDRTHAAGAGSHLTGRWSRLLSVFVLSPFVSHIGTHVIWEGPKIPVVGVPRRDERGAGRSGDPGAPARSGRLAFAAYALLLDLDRLLQARRFRAPLGAGGRPRDAPRTDARARRGRSRRGAARARRRVDGSPRPRAPAVARSSRARWSARSTSPSRWRRAASTGRRATRAPGPPWTRARPPGARRRGRSLSSWGGMALAQVERLTFSVSRRGAPALATSRSSSSRGEIVAAARPVGLRASRRSCARSPGSSRTSTAAGSRAGSRSAAATRGRTPGRARGRGRLAVPGSRGPGRLRPRRERGRVRAREPWRRRRRRSGRASTSALADVGRRAARRAADGDALGRRAAARVPRVRRSRLGPALLLLDEPTSQLDPGRSRGDSRPGVRAGLGGRRLRAAADAAAASAATACSSSKTDDSRSTRRATRRWLARSRVPARGPPRSPANVGARESPRQGRQRELLVRLRDGLLTVRRSSSGAARSSR